MKDNDVTILVLSCDKYADLWKPFFLLFRKYWPECPYSVVLGSNTIALMDKRTPTILSGPDKDWSSSLLKILFQIRTPFVFLWLDDIFLTDYVSTEQFTASLEFIKRNNAKHLHVEPKPWPDRKVNKGKYGQYEKGSPYRVTTFGFWEVDSLQKLLISGESPWNFEIMGSYRSSYMDGFYCTMKPLVRRLHVVEKGKIFKNALLYCNQHKIPLDTSAREVISGTSFYQSEIQKIIFNTVIKISWKVRVRIMNTLRKIFVSY